MKRILVLAVVLVVCGSFAREVMAQDSNWAMVRRPSVAPAAVRQVPPGAAQPASQVQVVRYQSVDASGVPVETTVNSAPLYLPSQQVQTFRAGGCCQTCCLPCQQVVYANPCGTQSVVYSAPQTYGVFSTMTGANKPVYVGKGILGQPKAYVEGQPVRNVFRWLLP